jgi:hypothetical protein
MSVREVFVDWLTGSRYIRSLESRIVEQRQDFTERLGEKDGRIQELRTELAGLKIECDRMRLVLMPLGSPSGAMYAARFSGVKQRVVPEFSGTLDWQAELQAMLKQEEANGVPEQRREAVHESPANDGA